MLPLLLPLPRRSPLPLLAVSADFDFLTVPWLHPGLRAPVSHHSQAPGHSMLGRQSMSTYSRQLQPFGRHCPASRTGQYLYSYSDYFLCREPPFCCRLDSGCPISQAFIRLGELTGFASALKAGDTDVQSDWRVSWGNEVPSTNTAQFLATNCLFFYLLHLQPTLTWPPADR